MNKTDKINKMIDDICGKNITSEWHKLNYKFMPITVIPAKLGNEERFNELYKALLDSNFKQISRTKSGGISINVAERFTFHKYDVRQLNGCVELTVASLDHSCRIQFRLPNFKSDDDEEMLISAGQYLRDHWLPACKKFGIDMKDYACTKEEGLAYKKEIHAADIKIYDPAASYNVPYNNVSHIDFHKFYMSGLLHSHPEFTEVVSYLAEKAKTDKMHKTGLAAMIGFFQSPYCGYKYAKLSRDAINDAYSRFDEVKADMKEKGYRILATNTDGIWLVGEYHGPYEGPGLTEWSTDHKDCIIRFKSAGAYEYVEDGRYTPVVRGRTRLDKKKPRSEWSWGDIFKAEAAVEQWQFIEDEGIVWKE